MSEASLAAQRVAVTKMRAREALTALVPASHFMDRNERPERFPCVIVGEAQTVSDESECFDGSEVFLTFHVWTKENGFVACKSIAGEIRRALKDASEIQDGFECNFSFNDTIFIRDPGGELSHAVVQFVVLTEGIVGVA
ncbi:MAG: DUF3168 domain-containing protein [Alphaproteobacteria bacterium]|nr:DUF3168 domain-containing protein [Alphaproteobacteria bacterium]